MVFGGWVLDMREFGYVGDERTRGELYGIGEKWGKEREK
jgi:hypothetical protein